VLALPDDDSLTPAERFSLDLLVDLSALVRCEGPGGGATIRLTVTDSGAAASLASLRSRDWTISVVDREVRVDRALLAFVAEVAGFGAEQRSTAADRYNRVPSAESPMVQASAEREPVVSVIAQKLAAAARSAAPRDALLILDPWPEGHRWAAALTHDLDVVQWWPAFTLLRLAELTRRLHIGLAARVLGSVIQSAARDVVWDGVRAVLEIEASHGVRSTWFVLCGDPTFASARAGDLTYSIDSPLARRILSAVTAAGHELGLHGSFATSDDHSQFTLQHERLEAVTGRPVRGVRQHYLRWRPDSTPQGMATAGFSYDSTFGFADRNGFRLGVADVVPVWSAATQSTLPLDEVPFTWMDRALSKYRGVEDPNAWVDDALELADVSRAVQGLWVGIWHPNLTSALGFPSALEAYTRLVGELRAREPYVATMGELVAWRRARRAVRAVARQPDGTVILSDALLDSRIVIRGGDGRPVGVRPSESGLP
jgi:peptidoglycan/xylan/chitin deacetylase (PgdA/CDA1 family)